MSNLLIEANRTTMQDLFAMASGAASGAMKAMGSDNTAKNANGYSYSSIANAASKLIAVFPVLVSRTVSAETAQMASKYIEQISCQFIMLALQQANIDTAENGIEYLKKFHQNLDIGGNGVDAVVGAMQSWIDAYNNGKIAESATLSASMFNEMGEQDLNLDSLLESDKDLEISPRVMRELMEMMKANENLKFYDTQLNPISINDYIVNEFADGNYHVSVKRFNSINESSKYTEDDAKADANESFLHGKYWDEYLRRSNSSECNTQFGPIEGRRAKVYKELLAKQRAEDSEKERRRKETDYRTNRREHKEDRNNKKIDRARSDEKYERDERDRAQSDYARRNSGRNVSALKDQDIKKMNDAVPSMLVIKFYHKEGDTVSNVATEFIVGVKSKLIPVTTTEVLRRIMNDNKDGKKFINFMRTITGELKASELIFGLSRIKDDVKSCRVKGAYGDTWNLLANRAKAAKEAVKHGQRNDFSAITTLVISQYDADELFREENFDISDPKNAYHFMQSYNLMAFAIADDSTESLKILFDNGTKQFDEISYRMLERETQDGTYKKLINLMAASK